MPDLTTADNSIYKPTGLTNTKFSVRNSTILFETQNRNEYKSSEVTFAARFNSEYRGKNDNEVSVRWSIDKHSGDNIVKCFDVGYNITTGKTRIRYEHQHPDYTDVLAVGGTQGIPLSTDSFSEFKFVKLDYWDRTTLFQVFQKIDESGWTELFNYMDKDHYVDEYPTGAQIAIKVKDYTDNVILKDITVAEIEERVSI